jgi:hypothetical protein
MGTVCSSVAGWLQAGTRLAADQWQRIRGTATAPGARNMQAIFQFFTWRKSSFFWFLHRGLMSLSTTFEQYIPNTLAI